MRRKRNILKDNFLEESNNKIIELIKSDKPFIVSRFGLGQETTLTYEFIKNNKIINGTGQLNNNAGVYNTNKENLLVYFNLYNECIKNTDLLACFIDRIGNIQSYFFK